MRSRLPSRIANFIKRRKERVVVLKALIGLRRHRGKPIAGGGIDGHAQRLLNQRGQRFALMARLSLSRAKHAFINVHRRFHIPILSQSVLDVNQKGRDYIL